MIYVVPIVNTDPVLGPQNDGKQAVNVYDPEISGRRTVITTPEKAEQFIKDRNSTDKRGLALMAGTTGIGAIAGGIIGRIKSLKNSEFLNALVEKINPEFELAFNKRINENSLLFGSARELERDLACSDVLDKEAYKKFSWKLRELFNKKEFKFVQMGKEKISELASKATKEGAIMGGLGGLMAGCLSALVLSAVVVNKITQGFIKENQNQNQ